MNKEQWQAARSAQDSIREARRLSVQSAQAKEAAYTASQLAQKHEVYVKKGERIVLDAADCFIDLDIESDGKAGYGSLMSIGAITPRGETFYRELKPVNDKYIPSQRDFCEQHGLERERLLEEGQDPVEAIYDLDIWTREVAENRKPVLTAFNAAFDFSWIDLGFAEAGIENPFGVAGYCLKSLAMSIGLQSKQNATADYDWANTTKNRLPAELVPVREFTHHALDDAKWQQELHYAMVGYIAEDLHRGQALGAYIDTDDSHFDEVFAPIEDR